MQSLYLAAKAKPEGDDEDEDEEEDEEEERTRRRRIGGPRVRDPRFYKNLRRSHSGI